MTPLLTVAEPVTFDPLKNKAYRLTGLGRDIADFLAWMDLGGASPKTLLNYEADLAKGALMYPDATITTLTDGEMLQISRAFPTASRRVRTAAWRSFFKWALRSRKVTVNPCDALPVMRKEKPRVPTTFTDSEVDVLLTGELRDAVCMGVLFDCGLRKAEARNLRFRHCLPESGRLIVLQGKGGRDRIVPLTARLTQLLNDMILLERVEPNDYVFYGVIANDISRKIIRQRPVGEGTFARWWRRCIDEAGIPYRVPHTARHTFATNLRRKGLQVDDLQTLLGHSSIATTANIYVHSTVDEVADRMRLIGAL
jgi:integrase